jgi:predicted MFS family arabinose efflux permease
LIAASVASQTLGMAIGPAVGGILAGRFGYATITHVGLGLEALAFLLLAWMFAALRPPPHARGAAWSS